MSKSGIVNVRMVITEEKILSNIDKVKKIINPNSKKQIVQLEEDSYFKDLIESIKTYLIEYPKKKNFPVNVYKATYGLVEFATTQFEENTKKIEELIKQREENIAISGKLKKVLKAADSGNDEWQEKLQGISNKISNEVIENINIIANCKDKEESKEYKSAMKLVKARINNLESNLHIEIDMERLEDCSKALSFIGIEIAEALKLIPTPEEQIEVIELQEDVNEKDVTDVVKKIEKAEKVNKGENVQNSEEIQEEQEKYVEETTFEVKPSLWQRIKKSKVFKAATFIFRIKVKIELPSNALPEGNKENV